MTFSELKVEIKDRLGYTSTSADTRVGRLINKIYREIGTSIGMSFTRQTNTSEVVTIGNASVTFSETEKILQVWRLDGSSNPVMLAEKLLAELRESVTPSSDKPTAWALVSTTSNGCTIRLDASPATAYTLYADVIAEVSDLSGSTEPAFPESFHDIIIEGVLRDEYRKQEKVQLARDSANEFQRRLSDLRMFVAKSNYMDIQQGKISSGTSSSRAGSGTASQAVTGAASSTDNAVVRWNGTGGTSIQNSSVIIDDTDNITMASTGSITLPNTGLHLLDTNATHDLIIVPGSNLTADRNLTLTTGDAARTLTISGDATVSQDYSTAGSPTLTGLTLTGALTEQGDGTVTGSLTFDADALHILDTNASHDLIITPGSDLTADRVLTLTTGDAARTVTISGNATISQDYSTAGSPQLTGIELGHASDTTLTRSSAGNLAVEGNVVYRVGGTDVALADGGTGATLADPGADRIMFWDDSAGAVDWLTAGSGLSIAGTTITASSTGAPTEETTVLTGTNNDFDLDAAYTYLRCNNASALILTGFTVTGAAPTGGDRLVVHNVGSSTVQVTTQGAGSTAANRVICPSAVGQIIGAGGSMGFIYDTTTDRWRMEWVEPGTPIAVAHGGLTFGGWTVASGDMTYFKYQQRGQMVTYWIGIVTASVSGSPTSLTIQESSLLPGGFTASDSDQYVFARVSDNGTLASGVLYTGSTIILRFDRLDQAAWANATDTTSARGIITVSVA